MNDIEVGDIPAPLALCAERVRREWIDANGHMNVAYYTLIFDYGTDAFYDYIGIGTDYRRRSDCSHFTLESHIVYARELREGDPVRVTTQLLGFDAKRVHYFHFMHHGEEGYLAATNELISIHVDMGARRSAPMPDEVMRGLERVMAAHGSLARPPQAGRAVSLKQKKP